MTGLNQSIIMVGCFDTKGEDFSYLHKCLVDQGQGVISINTGVMDSRADFSIDFNADTVAKFAGTNLKKIKDSGDRGKAVELMGRGAAKIIATLVSENKIKGAIGMGGGGGTYIALSAMQGIPLGIPKLCLTTIASKDLTLQMGTKDITLMPSIVDVAGLNSISRLLIKQAASAIGGMVSVAIEDKEKPKGSVAISMFGNTTKCVDKCTALLNKEGYEVLSFHATLDVTTTELADYLCGGICSAGEERMNAAGEMGIPQVVVPGCLDMVNFAELDSVPQKYKSRQLYSWAPDVTLMRTNEKENAQLGEMMANKINKSTGSVSVLLPNKGISVVDSEGGIFYRPDYDRILFDAIKRNTKKEIPVKEFELNINDEEFARNLVKTLLAMIK
jgi:uncharacterized protein (UPF0261 family)